MARFLSVPPSILANMCSVRKVHRTARIARRTTRAQRRRCYGLLRSAGDVWAWVIDCNRQLREWHCPQVTNFQALCRELTGTTFGELPRHCAEAVLKNYSIAFFEAAKRQKLASGRASPAASGHWSRCGSAGGASASTGPGSAWALPGCPRAVGAPRQGGPLPLRVDPLGHPPRRGGAALPRRDGRGPGCGRDRRA